MNWTYNAAQATWTLTNGDATVGYVQQQGSSYVAFKRWMQFGEIKGRPSVNKINSFPDLASAQAAVVQAAGGTPS